jgi:hypothetical protein
LSLQLQLRPSGRLVIRALGWRPWALDREDAAINTNTKHKDNDNNNDDDDDDNNCVHDFPDAAALNLSYADDFSLSESAKDLDLLGRKLTDSLKLVAEWANKNKLIIAPEKSHVTLFTPWNREIDKCPDVFYKGVLIPVNVQPKFLGLNLDSLFNLTPH